MCLFRISLHTIYFTVVHWYWWVQIHSVLNTVAFWESIAALVKQLFGTDAACECPGDEVLWPSWPCSSLWMARPWRREALQTARCNKARDTLRYRNSPRVRSVAFCWDKPGLLNVDICKHVNCCAAHASCIYRLIRSNLTELRSLRHIKTWSPIFDCARQWDSKLVKNAEQRNKWNVRGCSNLAQKCSQRTQTQFWAQNLAPKGQKHATHVPKYGGGKQTRTKVQNNQMKAHVTTSVVYRT